MRPRDDAPAGPVALLITVGRARALRDLVVSALLLAAAGVSLLFGVPSDPVFVAAAAAFCVGAVAAVLAAAGVDRRLGGRRLDPPAFRGVVTGVLAAGMFVIGVYTVRSGLLYGWLSVAAGALFLWLGVATVRRERRGADAE
ncbi:hypothetical protein [Halobaculum lipolyticum]|uniref:Integral membrane protein n=1 Tax=Halobaculum lipolyticum TaxID=3032001 RepID=A0ABD5W3Z3_9EURY|nr:hypothetical protein [Halobaculum sp. DT31]